MDLINYHTPSTGWFTKFVWFPEQMWYKDDDGQWVKGGVACMERVWKRHVVETDEETGVQYLTYEMKPHRYYY